MVMLVPLLVDCRRQWQTHRRPEGPHCRKPNLLDFLVVVTVLVGVVVVVVVDLLKEEIDEENVLVVGVVPQRKLRQCWFPKAGPCNAVHWIFGID